MSEVVIRKAIYPDIDAIQRLYRQLDRHHVTVLPEVFQSIDGDARTPEMVATFIMDEDADYLVAERDDEILGFLTVQEKSHPTFTVYKPYRFAMIENAVVDRSHRGQGIGTALFDAAKKWAAERALRFVQTSLWTANDRAKRFYLDRGFRSITEQMELDLSRRDADQES